MSSSQTSSKLAAATRSVVGPSKNTATFDPAQRYAPYPTGGTIDGHVAPGWDKVRDAFGKNFADGQEVQAQLCITRGDGESLVDLMGVNSSFAAASTSDNSDDGYTLDTVQPIWSCGKNLEVLIVAILVDRGVLIYIVTRIVIIYLVSYETTKTKTPFSMQYSWTFSVNTHQVQITTNRDSRRNRLQLFMLSRE